MQRGVTVTRRAHDPESAVRFRPLPPFRRSGNSPLKEVVPYADWQLFRNPKEEVTDFLRGTESAVRPQGCNSADVGGPLLF